MSEKSNPLDFTEYAFFHKLTEFPFVDAVYLYGSRAKGEHTERSDIDLAVLCPEATDAEWNQVRELMESAPILVSIDVIRWDTVPRNSTFRQGILRERLPVFVRRASRHADTMAEIFAMMDWHLKLLRDTLEQAHAAPDVRHRALASAYQRCFRYLWRSCRRALALYGLHTHSPLSTFKHAYMEGWLPQRKLWEAMYRDWLNLMPDDAPDTLATLAARLPGYLSAMEGVTATLKAAVAEADTRGAQVRKDTHA